MISVGEESKNKALVLRIEGNNVFIQKVQKIYFLICDGKFL